MKHYTKKTQQPMFPWTPGCDMTGVSVSEEDKNAGSPLPGDMIAVNPKNPEDQWLVAEQFFKDNYAEVGNSAPQSDFGYALREMKNGALLRRRGWNGKGMFIFFTEGRDVPNDKGRSFRHFEEVSVTLAGHIDMRAADGSYVSGWLASQTDMLADDWEVVPVGAAA